MKAITFFTSQYASSSLQWSYINSCDATDFIFIPSAYPTPNTAAAEMAIAIKTLIDGRGSKTTNVYIGTPGITSLNFGLNPSASTLTAFLTSVYGDSNISSHTYRSKIKGVYMNQESLYGDVDYNNLLNGTMSGNLQIKRMKDISDWVKAGNVGGTKFIWIPYYGYGEIAGIVIKNI